MRGISSPRAVEHLSFLDLPTPRSHPDDALASAHADLPGPRLHRWRVLSSLEAAFGLPPSAVAADVRARLAADPAAPGALEWLAADFGDWAADLSNPLGVASDGRLDELVALLAAVQLCEAASERMLSIACAMLESAEHWSVHRGNLERGAAMSTWQSAGASYWRGGQWRADREEPRRRHEELSGELHRLCLALGALQGFLAQLKRCSLEWERTQPEPAAFAADREGRAQRDIVAEITALVHAESSPAAFPGPSDRAMPPPAPSEGMRRPGSAGDLVAHMRRLEFDRGGGSSARPCLCRAVSAKAKVLLGELQGFESANSADEYLALSTHLERNWLYYGLSVAAGLSLLCAVVVFRRPVQRAAIAVRADGEYFLKLHVLEPMTSLYNEVVKRHTRSIAKPDSVRMSKLSLQNMLRDWGKDYRANLSEEERAALSHLRGAELMAHAFEQAIKEPVVSVINGDLLQMLLIQVQGVKVETLEGVSAIDGLLKENQFNLEMMALAPAFLVAQGIMWSVSRAAETASNTVSYLKGRSSKKSRQKLQSDFLRQLANIEKRLMYMDGGELTARSHHQLRQLGFERLTVAQMAINLHQPAFFSGMSATESAESRETLHLDLAELQSPFLTHAHKLRLVMQVRMAWRPDRSKEKTFMSYL